MTQGLHAAADLHFGALSRRSIPLLVLRLAASLDDQPSANDALLWRLRGQGWGNPAALLRGGDLNCLARATIDGTLDDNGPLTVAFDGRVLFHGPVDRSPAWVDAARTAGGVPVLLTTSAAEDLTVGARDGLLIGAWGQLFHRGPGVAHPAL